MSSHFNSLLVSLEIFVTKSSWLQSIYTHQTQNRPLHITGTKWVLIGQLTPKNFLEGWVHKQRGGIQKGLIRWNHVLRLCQCACIPNTSSALPARPEPLLSQSSSSSQPSHLHTRSICPHIHHYTPRNKQWQTRVAWRDHSTWKLTERVMAWGLGCWHWGECSLACQENCIRHLDKGSWIVLFCFRRKS